METGGITNKRSATLLTTRKNKGKERRDVGVQKVRSTPTEKSGKT